MQASTPQIAKKPSSSPAEVEEISKHLELQFQQAKQTMEKNATNYGQPRTTTIHTRDAEADDESPTKCWGVGETNHRPNAQHTRCGHPNAARAWNTVHPTKERSCKTNSSERMAEGVHKCREREMRSSVGILRKLELPISSPPHMDATCMEGTNLPLSPSYAGKASGQNTPLRITSTSDTTNAIRSQFGTRAITQYTLATNHIELASCHKPATWKETSTWRSRPPCTLWPRTLTAT